MPEFIGQKTGKWWYITDNFGPWQVASKADDWYIINIKEDRARKVGPVRSKGINYYDRAVEKAEDLNIEWAIKFGLTHSMVVDLIEKHLPFFITEDGAAAYKTAPNMIKRIEAMNEYVRIATRDIKALCDKIEKKYSQTVLSRNT